MEKQCTVVIFEDSDEDFFLIEHMFNSIQSTKYNIHRAQTLEDFRKINIDDVQLIVMDYHLNGASGLDFIATLKTEYGNFAPFIFLTGVDNPNLYGELKQLNVFDYFIKSEMTISLLERACFYAIERFEASMRYNKEREFSKHLIENLRYFVAEIDDNDKLTRSNESFKKFKEHVFLQSSRETQNEFLDLLKSNEGTFYFEFTVGENIVHTKWEKITSQFSVNYTYIGEDITEETNKKETEISRRKLETLGHLAGGIAHELNNTLQPIILRHDMIKDIGTQIGNQDIIEHVDENKAMLRHGANIIADILDFSNSQEHDTSLQEECLITSIRNSLEVVQKSLPPETKLEITVDEEIAHYYAHIGHNNMFKFLSNIIHNAAQSMDMNGLIILNFSILDQTKMHSSPVLSIMIQDHGVGMDDNVAENIFSPFFTTRAPGKGTGLGMSVAHSIIQNAGGDINVYSRVGQGTKIETYIPVTPTQSAHN